MTRALSLYAIAPEASFDGTTLAEGTLPNSLGFEPSFYDRAFGLLASPTFLEPPHVAGVWSRVGSSL